VKREIQRCGKCAGGHGTEDCEVSVNKVVNFRGAHVAGDQKYPVQLKQVEIAKVRVVQRVSYPEAVKKVQEDGSRVRDPERIPVSSRFVPVEG
jgi:hypothetical protein